LAGIQKATDDLAAQVPDRNRWWSTRTTGQRFAAVVASALNTVNKEMFNGGGEDPIARYVEQDIQAQREEFEARRSSLTAKTSLYKMMRQQGLDDATASAAARLEMLRAAKDLVSDQVGAAKDKQMRAKGEMALDKLARDEQALEQARQEAVDKHALTRAEIALKQTQIAQASGKAAAPSKLTVLLPDGRQVVAPTEKDAELLRSQIAQGKSYKATLDRIASQSPGWMSRVLDKVGITTPEQANVNALKQIAVDKLRPATSGSTAEMGDPSQRAFRETLGQGLFESAEQYRRRMAGIGAEADTGLDANLSSIGAAPVLRYSKAGK